jgi:hypothetical protein
MYIKIEFLVVIRLLKTQIRKRDREIEITKRYKERDRLISQI